MLVLDALYPGTPSQLIANCKAVGAAGCLGYVWRPGGIGGWTSAHFNSLKSAGLITCPIVVPAGDGSTPYATLIAAARNYGFTAGPLVFDMESPYNLPPQAWWNGAITAARAAGFKAIKYGNAGDVQAYANGDGWWKASYIQTTTKPVPALPTGLVGWQYADMDPIGGVQYDASVFADIFQEADMQLDPNDPVVAELRADLNFLKTVVANVYNGVWTGSMNNVNTNPQQPISTELHDYLRNAAPAGGLTAAQQSEIDEIKQAIGRIEAALKGA